MPVIPVQTRLAPPSPGNAELPLGIGVAPATTITASASTPIRHSSFDIGHSAAAPAAVDLRIDSLVLHGFSPAEGRRAGAAFEQELTRLLTESPLSEYSRLLPASPASSSPALASLDASDIGHWSLVIGHSRGEATGRASARALHARLRA
jgi:hypothetical protein